MTVFKMPVPVTIMGRSSSITNSFVNGIVPCIEPTDAEIDAALEVLGMNRETIRCAYCGDRHTEWDHLNPLVVNKAPTGYISEIHNLVPACGKCNQSKGNSNWREWIAGSAKLSPLNRGVADLEERIRRLDAYEKTFSPVRIDFIELAGESEWAEYWSSYEEVIASMKEAQKISDAIKTRISTKVSIEQLSNQSVFEGN